MSRPCTSPGSFWKGVCSAWPHRRRVYPVEYGCPVGFWYGLDVIAQATALVDDDAVADIHLAADGYDALGVEAAVSAGAVSAPVAPA